MTKRMVVAMVLLGLIPVARTAAADAPCSFVGNTLVAGENGTSLVARLENPPRTKVVLTIDGPGGLNQELVWDPAVGDGLQHDALLPKGTYEILAFAEDDRIQTSQLLMVTNTRFFTVDEAVMAAKSFPDRSKNRPLAVMGSRVRTLTATAGGASIAYVTHPAEVDPTGRPRTTGKNGEFVYSRDNPRLILTCDDGRVELSRLRLNTRQLEAGSVQRSFLDQVAPTVVTDTLALIAEIAVERAKRGAMEIVRERFFEPICSELHLQRLQLGSSTELAFPRVCALLRSSRLEDLLAAGRSLVDAARDDVRLTLMPRLIAKADISPVAREVALLALRLGNEMLGGGTTDGAAIDLVITQMDRILRIGGVTSIDPVKAQFITEALGLKEPEQRESLITEVLLRFLPKDPGALVSAKATAEQALADTLMLKDEQACARPKETARAYVPADRTGCIRKLSVKLAKQADWHDRIRNVVNEDELIGLIDTVRGRGGASTFEEWLTANISRAAETIKPTLDAPPAALLRTCALRVAVGVVKWCSGRDHCTAADIATAMAKPENLFAPPGDDADLADTLCWLKPSDAAPWQLRLPAVRGPYVELASRAIAFLTPPSRGEERQRGAAMLRWMFDVAKVVVSRAGDESSPIQKLEEIVALFAQRDYVRAISQTVLMAAEAGGCDAATCDLPEELEKATNLLGAVGSYLQVYEQTEASDPAEAKAARKQALETLIDASTDRKHRAGERIFSFGVPVGFTGSWRWTPGTAAGGATGTEFGDLYQRENAFAWRLPLSLAVQWLPAEHAIRGWHLGLTFADLGNFVRGRANGADDEIRWKDFLQLGAQAGMILGNRRHTVLIALDVAWNPGLYERELTIFDGDGMPDVVTRSGAVSAGVTLAYYVPLFDLN